MATGEVADALSLADVDRVLAVIEREIVERALTVEDAVTAVRKARQGLALARIEIEAEALLVQAAEEAGFK